MEGVSYLKAEYSLIDIATNPRKKEAQGNLTRVQVKFSDFIRVIVRKNNLSRVGVDLEVVDLVPKIQVSNGRANIAKIVFPGKSSQVLVTVRIQFFFFFFPRADGVLHVDWAEARLLLLASGERTEKMQKKRTKRDDIFACFLFFFSPSL